jgi:hypothetical protein
LNTTTSFSLFLFHFHFVFLLVFWHPNQPIRVNCDPCNPRLEKTDARFGRNWVNIICDRFHMIEPKWNQNRPNSTRAQPYVHISELYLSQYCIGINSNKIRIAILHYLYYLLLNVALPCLTEAIGKRGLNFIYTLYPQNK